MGINPFGLKYYKSTDMTFNQISAIHVTMFNSGQVKNEQMKKQIKEQLKSLAIDKLGVISDDQIFFNERAIPKDLVQKKDDRLLINEDKFLKFVDQNGVIDHYIPEEQSQNQVKYQHLKKHVRLMFFKSDEGA